MTLAPQTGVVRWLSKSWPNLIYGAAVLLGAIGLALPSAPLLTFSGEVLLLPQLIQAQQRRNRRRRRGDSEYEGESDE